MLCDAVLKFAHTYLHPELKLMEGCVCGKAFMKTVLDSCLGGGSCMSLVSACRAFFMPARLQFN